MKKKERKRWTPEQVDIALTKYFKTFEGFPYPQPYWEQLATELYESGELGDRSPGAVWYFFKRTNGRIAKRFGILEVNVNNSKLQDQKIKDHFEVWTEKERKRNDVAKKLRLKDKRKLRAQGKKLAIQKKQVA